jgi:hypothetical protein
MQHIDHQFPNGKSASFPRVTVYGIAQLREAPQPVDTAPAQKLPIQPELPLDLPPLPAKSRRPRSSVHARQLAGLAAFCGRSVSWARTAERRLAAAGIIGHEILVFALVGEAFLRSQGQHRAQQFTQSFNHMIQLLD